ncbi:phenol hydroxylase subunit [Leptothrix discophora]|uniref:Phenol hydroxylase subunit n=2 Tax=Leptothrix discophora TaxID=89 RepID=A0ABT9G7G6_LEPDI|nr:phenol hydroxylase subunit [Leptothrix discophora]MDP4302207.1 phenol hydroxylase subunit [Leptothrix discophora]
MQSDRQPAPADTPQGIASGATEALPEVDLMRRYVRIQARRDDGLVAFEFSIGWTELAVELLLPARAFDEFCAVNRAVVLTD